MQCIRVPADCSSSDACDVLIMYKHIPSSNTIEATIATNSSNGYIAWAKSDRNQKMVKD